MSEWRDASSSVYAPNLVKIIKFNFTHLSALTKKASINFFPLPQCARDNAASLSPSPPPLLQLCLFNEID